ncbi:MAG TPA: GNAT family N-acetyltransferase [Beijerinckiaceae bacterium]|jgi:GNAT superfamily N-acetyltransferase|nr:GNAT family N-acetyltransferase [Beijerinckiaceae bacterium]
MGQADDALSVSLRGVTDLPPGKIAEVVTYLEMLAAPERREGLAGGFTLERFSDVTRYRALFRRVGERWLWMSRLVVPEAALRTILDDPAVEAFALRSGGEDIGILELDFRQPEECELAYFGVVPEAIGSGAGRFLMSEAVRRAWARPIRRFWVHTCTHDHPRALAFYQRSGFRAYKRAIEIADDPRLTGHLPRDAAPDVPVIG